MASTTSVPVSEYLSRSYNADCDYVDGRIEDRNVGEHDHAALQAALILWFGQLQKEWNIEVLPEQRIRISAVKFRVPDVCLVSLDNPVEQIITKRLLPASRFSRQRILFTAYRSGSMTIETLALPISGCSILPLKKDTTAAAQVSLTLNNLRFRIPGSRLCSLSFSPA